MAFQVRHRWILGKIVEAFGVDETVAEAALRKDANYTLLLRFFQASGPRRCAQTWLARRRAAAPRSPRVSAICRLFAYFQPRDGVNEHGEAVPGDGPSELFCSDGQREPLRRKGLYLLRLPDKRGALARVGRRSACSARAAPWLTCEGPRWTTGNDSDLDPTAASDRRVAYGTLTPSLLRNMHLVMSRVFRPMVVGRPDWSSADEEQVTEFRVRGVGVGARSGLLGRVSQRAAPQSSMDKFVDSLDESIKAMGAGLELRRPDKRLEVDRRTFSDLVADPEVLFHFVELLDSWCADAEKYLDEAEHSRWENSESGACGRTRTPPPRSSPHSHPTPPPPPARVRQVPSRRSTTGGGACSS